MERVKKKKKLKYKHTHNKLIFGVQRNKTKDNLFSSFCYLFVFFFKSWGEEDYFFPLILRIEQAILVEKKKIQS